MALRNTNLIKLPLPLAYSFKAYAALKKMDLAPTASFKVDVINEFLNFREVYFADDRILDDIKNAYFIVYPKFEIVYVDVKGRQVDLKISLDKIKKIFSLSDKSLEQIKTNIPLRRQILSDGKLDLPVMANQLLELIEENNKESDHGVKIKQQLEITQDLVRDFLRVEFDKYYIDVRCQEWFDGISDEKIKNDLKSIHKNISDEEIGEFIEYFRSFTKNEINALLFFSHANVKGRMAQGGLVSSSFLSIKNFLAIYNAMPKGSEKVLVKKNKNNTFSIRTVYSPEMESVLIKRSGKKELDPAENEEYEKVEYQDQFLLTYDDEIATYSLQGNSVDFYVTEGGWEYILKKAHHRVAALTINNDFNDELFLLIPCLIDGDFKDAFFDKLNSFKSALSLEQREFIVEAIAACHGQKLVSYARQFLAGATLDIDKILYDYIKNNINIANCIIKIEGFEKEIALLNKNSVSNRDQNNIDLKEKKLKEQKEFYLTVKKEIALLKQLAVSLLNLRSEYLAKKKITTIQFPKDTPFIELQKTVKILLQLLAQKPPVIDHREAYVTLWQQLQYYREQAELYHRTQEGSTGKKIEVKSNTFIGKIFNQTQVKDEKMWKKKLSTLASLMDKNIFDNKELADFAIDLENDKVQPIKHKLLKEVEPKPYSHIPKQKK